MAWELIAELKEVGSAHGRIPCVVRGKESRTRAGWEYRPERPERLTLAGQNCKTARRVPNAALPPEGY